jgi:zinc transport system permease protein
MLEALQFEFIRNALAAGLLASVICGILGSLVVVNRIVFLSGGIAHAAYGGIGLSYFMGWPYLGGTMVFSVAGALAMAGVTLRIKHRADAVIGVMWAVGMAIGIVLLDLTPGYRADLMSYLFGSILAVTPVDLLLLGITAFVTLGLALIFYNALLAMAFDEEFARVRGVPARGLYLAMIALLAAAIVLMIQVVGLILIIALLTIPPFIAEKFTRSLSHMMIWASVLSALFSVGGLFLAYRFNLTAGAAIILSSGVGFFLSLIVERFVNRSSAAMPMENGRTR